ncbi:MAG: DUF4272 domain-containing protein [Myxococcales bacterium]|nr:DUF4272 domain-containing protein [Myxococcales bacterium]
MDDLSALTRGLASKDATEREEAAQALAELREVRAAPYLVRALGDDSEQVRMWGAYGLGMLRRAEYSGALRKALLEDTSPLVGVWAAFGLLSLGEKSEAATLLSYLDDESLDVRNNAADAILSLPSPEAVRSTLERRLGSSEMRKRAWAAGVLQRLGHPRALEVWREALRSEEARLDAAVVATHLEDTSALRELLKLLLALPDQELERLAPEAGDLPLAELLSAPLGGAGLPKLLELAESDQELRGELLLLLGRGVAIEPELLVEVEAILSDRDSSELGVEVARLLERQPAGDRPAQFARIAASLPDAVVPAVKALGPKVRDELFRRLSSPSGEEAFLFAPAIDLLGEAGFSDSLGATPAAPREDQLATDPGADVTEVMEAGAEPRGEEEPAANEELIALAERRVAGEALSEAEEQKLDAFLAEIGASAEDFLAEVRGEDAQEPTAEKAARRALCIGATLLRLMLEEAVAAGDLNKDKASQQAKALWSWLTREGLDQDLSGVERELLQMDAGGWSEDDRMDVSWASESLAMLQWAIGLSKAPPIDKPSAADELVGALPLLEEPHAFIERAELRPIEELEAHREAWELWSFRTQQEMNARQASDGAEGELHLGELIAELEKEGFDRKAAERKGKAALAAEALRFASKKGAQKLAERGLLPKPLEGDFPFRGKPVSKLDDETLSEASGLAVERQRALVWLTAGGDWDQVGLEEG